MSPRRARADGGARRGPRRLHVLAGRLRARQGAPRVAGPATHLPPRAAVRALGRAGPAARAAALAAVALLLAALAAAQANVPALAGRVTDLAEMVPAPVRERLAQRLGDLEARTGAQVAVLTVESLGGEPIEDYAVRVFQAWGLGRRGADDGVLLVVARQERRMRIEVGYGLEGRLTDAVARRILDEHVRPRFQGGDFGAGIEAGVDGIVATLEGAPLPEAPAPRRSRPPLGTLLAAGGVFVIAVGTFSVLALLVDGAAGWILYVFLIPFYAAFPTIMFPPYGGVVAAGAWLVLFPILRALLRTPRVRRYRERHGWVMAPAGGRSSRGGRWRSGGAAGGGFSGGGFSSRGGSSGGGGGFSGGGGSSGGGGASSGW